MKKRSKRALLRQEDDGAREASELKFDFASRHDFLTGFRKRKQERRRLAVEKALERERRETIEVKKDHREEVKKRWKEVQLAEKQVERLIRESRRRAIADGRIPAPIMNSESLPELEDGDADPDAEPEGKPPATSSAQAAITVAFDREDDDPFGDCEVTTTIGGPGLDGSLWPVVEQPSTLALRLQRPRGTRGGGGKKGPTYEEEERDALTEEEWRERVKRRATNLAKEEARRKSVLLKRVRKQIAEKDRWKKKKVKKKKVSKSGKTSAKARRRRK